MKKFTLLLFFTHLSIIAFSQAIVSDSDGIIFLQKNSNSNNLEGKRGAFFGNHYFGDETSHKYSKFMSYYVSYEKENSAYATEKMVVAKKPIYNAVKDLDKFLTKEARKDRIPITEAKQRFEKILDTAIHVRFYQTSQFEALLKNAESPEEMEEIFNNVRIQ